VTGRSVIGAAGLTLTEMVMVVAIFSLLSALVFGTFRFQTQFHRRQSALAFAQGDLRVWLSRMTNDIRRTGYDPRETGDFGITVHQPTEIRFTTDADGDGVVDGDPRENLGYRLQSGVLQLWQGGTSWRPVLPGVTTLTFTYRDAKGEPVTNATRDVREVEIVITVEAARQGYSGGAPAQVSGSARVEIRNEAI
jgi:prepilin-type N-terminal cleavage/methylation domain-containing protein